VTLPTLVFAITSVPVRSLPDSDVSSLYRLVNNLSDKLRQQTARLRSSSRNYLDVDRLSFDCQGDSSPAVIPPARIGRGIEGALLPVFHQL
jgi:hypothetical protein